MTLSQMPAPSPVEDEMNLPHLGRVSQMEEPEGGVPAGPTVAVLTGAPLSL